MLVKEVMQRNVITAGENITIREAAHEMSRYGIGSLVIVKDEKVVGIVTERDILNAIAKGMDVNATKVEKIMVKDPITISFTNTVDDAAKIMAEKRIKKLPVMDGEKLVGIITASDLATIQPRLIESLANLLRVKFPLLTGG